MQTKMFDVFVFQLLCVVSVCTKPHKLSLVSHVPLPSTSVRLGESFSDGACPTSSLVISFKTVFSVLWTHVLLFWSIYLHIWSQRSSPVNKQNKSKYLIFILEPAPQGHGGASAFFLLHHAFRVHCEHLSPVTKLRTAKSLFLKYIALFYKGIPFINESGHQDEDPQVQNLGGPTLSCHNFFWNQPNFSFFF